MKRLLVMALLVVGMTTFAQEKETKKEPRQKLTTDQKIDLQVKRLTKDLDLNEKQVKDVRVLVAKEVEKREAKRAEMKETREMRAQKREEAKANMEKEQAATSAEMKKILTPEQFAKWEKIREERKASLKEKMLEMREDKSPEKGEQPLKKG
ncbi:hypothetical protein [Flavobacterium sp. XGLA_31]|uniref:hypothetical protein n=1 Tax=Flavobacterium sp. XGLA_31 TaxID=3447666 RepID=UPI003F396E37